MKLVVAFIQDYDCDHLLQAVTSAGLSATKDLEAWVASSEPATPPC